MKRNQSLKKSLITSRLSLFVCIVFPGIVSVCSFPWSLRVSFSCPSPKAPAPSEIVAEEEKEDGLEGDVEVVKVTEKVPGRCDSTVKAEGEESWWEVEDTAKDSVGEPGNYEETGVDAGITEEHSSSFVRLQVMLLSMDEKLVD